MISGKKFSDGRMRIDPINARCEGLVTLDDNHLLTTKGIDKPGTPVFFLFNIDFRSKEPVRIVTDLEEWWHTGPYDCGSIAGQNIRLLRCLGNPCNFNLAFGDRDWMRRRVNDLANSGKTFNESEQSWDDLVKLQALLNSTPRQPFAMYPNIPYMPMP